MGSTKVFCYGEDVDLGFRMRLRGVMPFQRRQLFVISDPQLQARIAISRFIMGTEMQSGSG